MVESFSHFISADKLLEIHSEVTILDCSVDPAADQRQAFLDKHIAGAIYLDLANFRDTESPYMFMMPKEALVKSHLTSLGVGLDKQVVCYDRSDNKWATRGAYVLQAWGFDNVKVLDGGLKNWGDRPTESGESKKGSGTNFNFQFRSELVATFEDIQSITSG